MATGHWLDSRLFQAYGQTLVITASASTQAVALPVQGGEGNRDIRIMNDHSAHVHIKTGDSAVVAKIKSSGSASMVMLHESTMYISAPTSHTHIAAIAASSSGDVFITTGVVIK